MIKRQILRLPPLPLCFDNSLCELLTDLCFNITKNTTNVDLIFVYGTPFFIDQAANTVIELLHRKVASKIIITGGMMPHGETLFKQKSEARLIYENIPLHFKNLDFYLEEESQNTLDNVVNSLRLFDISYCKKICFVFPAHGGARGYLTLKKFFPNAEITHVPYNPWYPEDEHSLAADMWHLSEKGRQRIWGEFLRIKEYSYRGDITLDERTECLLKKINAMIKLHDYDAA